MAWPSLKVADRAMTTIASAYTHRGQPVAIYSEGIDEQREGAMAFPYFYLDGPSLHLGILSFVA